MPEHIDDDTIYSATSSSLCTGIHVGIMRNITYWQKGKPLRNSVFCAGFSFKDTCHGSKSHGTLNQQLRFCPSDQQGSSKLVWHHQALWMPGRKAATDLVKEKLQKLSSYKRGLYPTNPCMAHIYIPTCG